MSAKLQTLLLDAMFEGAIEAYWFYHNTSKKKKAEFRVQMREMWDAGKVLI